MFPICYTMCTEGNEEMEGYIQPRVQLDAHKRMRIYRLVRYSIDNLWLQFIKLPRF